MEILDIQGLKKRFGKLKAVDGINFFAKEGECFGLLGPNGAGKSTCMELIEGVTEPDSGEILFAGKPRGRSFYRQLGVQFQRTALPDSLTVKETLNAFKRLYPEGLGLNEVINLCQMGSFANSRHERISGGQRQRLLLGIALIHDPKLLLLDEPTAGLDPQSRRHLWDIVHNIKKRKKTLILTTHHMDEAYELCDRIAIMDHGKIIAIGSPRDLLDKHCQQMVIELSKASIKGEQVNALNYPWQETGHSYRIHTEKINHLMSKLISQQVDLTTINIRQSNLEDLFIQLTGKELRDV